MASPSFETRASADSRPSRATGRQVELIYGHDSILSLHPLVLQIAALGCDSREAEELARHLAARDPKKIPCLLLLPAENDEPAVMGFSAAVLLFEYRLPLGLNRVFGGSHIFSSSDFIGRRTVFAPRLARARVAARAIRFLFEHRHAQLARVIFNQLPQDPDAADEVQAVLDPTLHSPIAQWSIAERPIKSYLPLQATFDATLARIGPRTRWNLRYYRRRTERDLGCTFIPNADVSLKEFIAFNEECMYAATDAKARYQELTSLERPLFAGIKDRNGRWLALVGGRRRTREIVIDWQMNRQDLPLYSLSTVLRSYLIEHEIQLGTTRLYIDGGTPQRIGHYFLDETLCELGVRRNSRYAAMLVYLFRRFIHVWNPLAGILQDASRVWLSW